MTRDQPRKPFWVSWWIGPSDSGFTYEGPWWVSGERMHDDAKSICAAVMARDGDHARAIIAAAHDEPRRQIEWRFVNERDDDWSPFGDRFVRREWMLWPYPITDGSVAESEGGPSGTAR